MEQYNAITARGRMFEQHNKWGYELMDVADTNSHNGIMQCKRIG